jgi:nucleoside-diphosphate-sugar epimerase
MRVLFVGGTGPVGQVSVPYLLDEGHDVAVAHTGAHEPPGPGQVEHLHGDRETLLAAGGPAEHWKPDIVVDTFAGGATAAKANELGQLGERCRASQIVAVSSIDVYRHCAAAGVDGNEPVELPLDALPLEETAARRSQKTPGGGVDHDNVAMENALHGAPRITVLRPGAIYGSQLHPRVLREWYLVGKVARGERRLELPAGGTQLFHRVALDRVGRAVAAAVRAAPGGRWECNVADPRDLTYGGLARVVAEQLDWEWETRTVGFERGDHPWNVRHPVIADTGRLRQVLGVVDPDPLKATTEQIRWLWDRREEFSRLWPA